MKNTILIKAHPSLGETNNIIHYKVIAIHKSIHVLFFCQIQITHTFTTQLHIVMLSRYLKKKT